MTFRPGWLQRQLDRRTAWPPVRPVLSPSDIEATARLFGLNP